MANIIVTQDPSLYLRNRGLANKMYNRMADSFTTNRNKEHKRPVPEHILPTRKK